MAFGGQNEHKPTDSERKIVERMAGFGAPHKQIAKALGICANTLRRHYEEELVDGKSIANATVAQSLFDLAVDGKNVTAMIFWLKAQAGWREARAPLEFVPPESSESEVDGYTDAELLLLERVHVARRRRGLISGSVIDTVATPSAPAPGNPQGPGDAQVRTVPASRVASRTTERAVPSQLAPRRNR